MIFLAVDDEVLQLNKLVSTIKMVKPDAEIYSFNDPKEAFKKAKEVNIDVACLDIEMGAVSGIDLAKKLKELNPKIDIIFVTGYTEYAFEAFNLRASGYLFKPVTKENLEIELNNLRYPMQSKEKSRLKATTFGDFEVYYDDKPLKFERSKTKELLAYLIDKNGASASTSELSKALFNEDKSAYIRNLIADLSKTLKKIDKEKVLIKSFNAYAIDTNEIQVDYYDFLEGEAYAVRKYNGEYMKNYPWAKSLKKKKK